MRRAWAASRRRSASLASARRGGRSSTSRSTARPETSAPARRSPSPISAGRRTTSQRRSTPRAAASSGSKVRPPSSQATMPPAACASATERSASVVLPDEASPRSVAPARRGRPPVPRSASRAGKPVETLSVVGSAAEPGFGLRVGTVVGSASASSSGRGARARAPRVAMASEVGPSASACTRGPLARVRAMVVRASPIEEAAAMDELPNRPTIEVTAGEPSIRPPLARRMAALPQRASRRARALPSGSEEAAGCAGREGSPGAGGRAFRRAEVVVMARPMIEQMFDMSTTRRRIRRCPRPWRPASPSLPATPPSARRTRPARPGRDRPRRRSQGRPRCRPGCRRPAARRASPVSAHRRCR
jgi:hypothetical protein